MSDHEDGKNAAGGMLDQIIGALGGRKPAGRLAMGKAHVDDPPSLSVAHRHAPVPVTPTEAMDFIRERTAP